jgi:predicted HTH transcriptional regulator
MATRKSIKEEFAKFCESPDRTKFRDLLKQNTGEYPHIDFKEMWLEKEKLAKHVLGFANSEGGVLVFGVKEEHDGKLTIRGLDKFEDKTDIKSKLKKYLPSEIEFEIHNFEYDDSSEWKDIKNKNFQVIVVEDRPQHLPFLALSSSGDILHKNRVYYRGKTSTDEATYDELKKIINRRLDTNTSTTAEDSFKEHLNQLKILYSFIDRYSTTAPYWITDFAASLSPLSGTIEKNQNYPDEDFEAFIVKMITRKKSIIESQIRF